MVRLSNLLHSSPLSSPEKWLEWNPIASGLVGRHLLYSTVHVYGALYTTFVFIQSFVYVNVSSYWILNYNIHMYMYIITCICIIHVYWCFAGNTKVISQSALQTFQEEMGKVLKDPYKVWELYTCTCIHIHSVYMYVQMYIHVYGSFCSLYNCYNNNWLSKKWKSFVRGMYQVDIYMYLYIYIYM